MKRIQSKTSHLFSLMPCDTAEDTLLCLNNLAGVLRSVNEIDDAEECYKEIGRNRANGVFNEEIRPWGRSMLSKGSAGRVCSKIVSPSGLFTISCCFACCTAVKLRPSYNGDLDAGVSWWSELTLVWSWEGGGTCSIFGSRSQWPDLMPIDTVSHDGENTSPWPYGKYFWNVCAAIRMMYPLLFVILVIRTHMSCLSRESPIEMVVSAWFCPNELVDDTRS